MVGALLILSGDFQQIIPVISKSTLTYEINACLKKSLAQILCLTKSMGVELSKNEITAHFTQKLLQIGEGTYPTDQTTRVLELNNDFFHIVTTENKFID